MPEPLISVIVPCLNEEPTIALLLEALQRQSFPSTQFEVVIADGNSTDGTRQRIAKFQLAHPHPAIRVIDNPSRAIPAGLNLAIAAARGGVILRLDAHSVPDKDYLEQSLADLKADKGWNVGGRWDIRPGSKNWIASAIALAAGHPIGIGDAQYRFSEQAQHVDTVPFGCFKKELIDQIGPFDESLQANEDYEFNARIRAAGGQVWLNPAIRSVYFARAKFSALMKQYSRYGYWKWRMIQRFPTTLRWRQALPPLFVLGLFLGPLLVFVWPWAKMVWLSAVVSYVTLLALVGIQITFQTKDLRNLVGVPAAIFIMHSSYGSAFLWSIIRSTLPGN